MKKIIYISLILLGLSGLSSCNNWLDVLPSNEQVTDNYWKSKEDVEAVLVSGYYYMRQMVPSILSWGEVRGGTLYSNNTKDIPLQNFNITPSSSICDYAIIYKVINMANSVLKYAPVVRNEDNTYQESMMNSHLTEAYFMRAYCYFLLVKAYRDVPMILEAYVNDEASYLVPKSSADTIIAQVKADIETALATGAAKYMFEEDWQSKGRATIWALYALKADVCLWDEDYDNCIVACNEILNASSETSSFRPVFISDPLKWIEIFYPGNSNESIFELNWDNATYGETNNFGSYFSSTMSSSRFKFTEEAIVRLKEETTASLLESGITKADGRVGRMLLSSYRLEGTDLSKYETETKFCMYKYMATDVANVGNIRIAQDANFILYRVAEILLMKAEAMVMKGPEYYQTALDLIKMVHQRASLPALTINVNETDELEMLTAIIEEREMEFIAEGKRWFDLLRFGKMQNYKYKEYFINMVIERNQTTNPQWIRSVLNSNDAHYMPLPYSEIEVNSLLIQNPYYATTTN